ncbi:hypothetical protein EV175_003118 [Coemansia sp. RSA 1933]|nr:hypothetical protein EV175_003118 [Coemansia sp. RSA 1933]
MLEFIRRFSNVTDLKCGFEDQYLKVDVGESNSFIDKLYNEHYPLSHRLKYWKVETANLVPDHQIPTIAMMLVVLCPNFAFASLLDFRSESYKRHVETAIAQGFYSEHCERLECLLHSNYIN